MVLVVFLCLFSFPARADTLPTPQHKADLALMQQKLENEKRQEAILHKKLENVESDLKKTRATLVALAKSVKDNERRLQILEKNIAHLEEEQKTITARLKADYGSISNLVLALERIRRTPPESLIIRPGAPLQTAQSAMLLQTILPNIYERASQLSSELDRLDTIEETLRNDTENERRTASALEKKQIALSILLKKREKLYKTTQQDYKHTAESVQRIAQESRSLQDLLIRLKQAQRKNRIAAATGKLKGRTSVKMPRNGAVQLPLSGIIRVRYGEKDGIGAISQGLTIEGRPGALVVAPMGGIIRFAGDFKNHGKIVILEHEKGYHSLVTGLFRIDTVTGQSVHAGEPLGILSAVNVARPTLYYELRYKGDPVNPSIKFAELS